MADNSRLKIRLAHLTPEEIKKNFARDINVTEEEIDQEIQNNNVEITDPETDRERIRNELMDKKLESIKENIASKVNEAVGNGASFNTAASILKGKITTSETFKIGEKIKVANGDNNAANTIGNSRIFIDTLMVMPINSSSPVIASKTGLYIFTPIERFVTDQIDNPDAEGELKNNLAYASINMITRNLVKSLSEKSKVIKNLKTD